jgi:hypothetical protein
VRCLGTKVLVTLFAGLVVLCAFADTGEAQTPSSAQDHTTACAILTAGSLSISIPARPALPADTDEFVALLPAISQLTSPVRSVDHPPEHVA